MSLTSYTYYLNISISQYQGKKRQLNTSSLITNPESLYLDVQLPTLEARLKGIWNENKHSQSFSHPSHGMFLKFLWLCRCIFFLPKFLNTPEQMWPSVVFVSSATNEGENSLPRLGTNPRCKRRVNAVWRVVKCHDNTLRGGPAESLSSGSV